MFNPEELLHYKVIAQKRDIDNDNIDEALKIVRKFIIDRKLILFGGLAIDYALRLKGSHIYPDDERPDYDFLSKDSVKDSYDLADILNSKGFKNVKAFKGIHVQTMRVRTDFISVADIGYTPDIVFDQLPIIDYNGIKIIHPDYQRMDMHLAFCFPFSNPPREDIFHRWKKDWSRLMLFHEKYPISFINDVEVNSTSLIKLTIKLDHELDDEMAFHGINAFTLFLNEFERLMETIENSEHSALISSARLIAPKFTIKNNNELIIDRLPQLNSNLHCTFVSYNPIKYLKQYEWYHPYMDVISENIRSENVCIFSSAYRLLSVSIIEEKIVSSIHYNLLYFIFLSIYDSKNKELYYKYYSILFEMMMIAKDLLSDELFVKSPFAPSIETMGSDNYSNGYIIQIAGMLKGLNAKEMPGFLHLDIGIKDLLLNLPRGYTPGSPQVDFDYSKNQLFKRDGSKV